MDELRQTANYISCLTVVICLFLVYSASMLIYDLPFSFNEILLHYGCLSLAATFSLFLIFGNVKRYFIVKTTLSAISTKYLLRCCVLFLSTLIVLAAITELLTLFKVTNIALASIFFSSVLLVYAVLSRAILRFVFLRTL